MGHDTSKCHVRYVQRICLGCSNGDEIIHLRKENFDVYHNKIEIDKIVGV